LGQILFPKATYNLGRREYFYFFDQAILPPHLRDINEGHYKNVELNLVQNQVKYYKKRI